MICNFHIIREIYQSAASLKLDNFFYHHLTNSYFFNILFLIWDYQYYVYACLVICIFFGHFWDFLWYFIKFLWMTRFVWSKPCKFICNSITNESDSCFCFYTTISDKILKTFIPVLVKMSMDFSLDFLANDKNH